VGGGLIIQARPTPVIRIAPHDHGPSEASFNAWSSLSSPLDEHASDRQIPSLAHQITRRSSLSASSARRAFAPACFALRNQSTSSTARLARTRTFAAQIPIAAASVTADRSYLPPISCLVRFFGRRPPERAAISSLPASPSTVHRCQSQIWAHRGQPVLASHETAIDRRCSIIERASGARCLPRPTISSRRRSVACW